jgi:hypothetical protein
MQTELKLINRARIMVEIFWRQCLLLSYCGNNDLLFFELPLTAFEQALEDAAAFEASR